MNTATNIKKATMITSTNILRGLKLFALIGFTVTGAFSYAGAGHGHGDHGHAQAGHHADQDEPALVYTHYTEHTELFVEFAPLVQNRASTFIVHFTRMDNFEPLTRGTLDVLLKKQGKTVARFRVKRPARTGIFLPEVTARQAGEYQLLLAVRDGDLQAVHDLGLVTVFPSADAVRIHQSPTEGEINYSKEQQWNNPFAITQARVHPLRPSVPGFATLTAPNDGYAVIRAASDGYFNAATIINAGASVAQGQQLGSLLPRLGDGADIGSLLLAQERAKSQLQLAKADVERLTELVEQGAVPERRLQEARQALDVAAVALQTHKSRIAQRSGAQQSAQSQAGILLTAPLAGEVIDVSVRPGSFVRAGDALFTIADASRRWLDVQVPEKFAHNMHSIHGAWITHNQQPVLLDESTGARVVKVSRRVDPQSRTVNVAIEYPSHAGPTLLGSRIAARVYTGDASSTLAVPAGAIIDDA
ncbi:MAG TPA: efflux RND transporter periplasmic adaptor subunit [Marinagarivorans sp.]